MSDEVMEALDSGTSSEFESGTPESPIKDVKSPKCSPKKIEITSPAADDISNLDSDSPLCLSDNNVLKAKSTISLDSDENLSLISLKSNKEQQKATTLEIVDDSSNSSDVPLIKFVGSGKKNESNQEKEKATSAGSCSSKKKLKTISESDFSSDNSGTSRLLDDTSDKSTIASDSDENFSLVGNKQQKKATQPDSKSTALEMVDDGSNSSDVALIKFVGSGKKKENEQEKEKASTAGSCSIKKKLETISESDFSSDNSETSRLLDDTSAGSSSTDIQVCELPKSNTKKTSVKVENTKKINLKRKRSGDSDDGGKINAKTKRKLDISSDSDSDENFKGKSFTPVSTSRKKKTSLSAVKKNKPDSVTIKKKLASKNSSVQNESIASPTKSERKIDHSNQTPNSRLSDHKKTKKLDTSDILERLNDSSNASNPSSSSEDVEMEEPQKAKGINEAISSSDSDDDSDAILISFKENNKILQQKKSNNSESSESDSDSNAVTKKTKGKSGSVARSSETKAVSSSSSEQESENVSPKKKKAAPKREKIAKKESKKDDKKKPGSKIARLQRYLKEAGIRVQKYETLWQGCKNDKARAEKLLELLHERGLKGKPSIAECRKLKRKFEKEKEISELNTSNIISSNGRSRRGATNPFASRRSPSPQSIKKQEASPKSSPEFKKMFGRLRNIVDSEEDSD